MKTHPDGTVTLTATEATDLKELFDYLLTGRRLEAGFGADSQARYLRFVALRRALMEHDHT
jgi:hypothetical protein